MSKVDERIEEITSEILLKNDMYTIPVDVIMLANNNEIKVYEANLPKEVSGAIRYNNGAYEILVNENDVDARKRFTVAHELGHYFLHLDMLKESDVHIDILYRTELKNVAEREREKEADYFAGALLMNRTLLERLRNNNDIAELAEIFDVSVSAMTVRLDVLGIL